MPSTSRYAEFVAGIRAELPLLLGVAPFGMAYGAFAVDAGVSRGLAQAMSVIIFGGASQLVAVDLMRDSAPGIVLALTVAFVNLRHLLYGASLAPHLATVGRLPRVAVAYLLTDEAYAASVARYAEDAAPPRAHWFLLGAGVALWVCWQMTTAAGVFVGAAVPESWSLDFALPLTFLAILVPALSDRAALAAAGVAAAVAVVGFDWAYKSGLIAAALAGIAAGLAIERMLRERATAGVSRGTA
jgi:4-azaleucine resistance transporter AzlC